MIKVYINSEKTTNSSQRWYVNTFKYKSVSYSKAFIKKNSHDRETKSSAFYIREREDSFFEKVWGVGLELLFHGIITITVKIAHDNMFSGQMVKIKRGKE